MDISDLILTDEQWAAMSEEEKLKAVRDGLATSSHLEDIQKNGSPELQEACKPFLTEAKTDIAKIFDAVRGKINKGIMPEFSLPKINHEAMRNHRSKQTFDFTSSAALINELSALVELWKKNLDQDVQPVIVAIFSDGTSAIVETISGAGQNGIAIEGLVGGQRCMLITHQASLQIFCYAEKIKDGSQPRIIGFYPNAPERTTSEDVDSE
jgi:hypothetical protein